MRLIIPAASPALYLNELVRAGIEAEMTTFHLFTISKKNALSELPLALTKKADKPGKKAKKPKQAEPEMARFHVWMDHDSEVRRPDHRGAREAVPVR